MYKDGTFKYEEDAEVDKNGFYKDVYKYMPMPKYSTSLIIASMFGYKDLVSDIIENNANVNIQNDYGVSALMLASINGYIEIVKMLINSGVDLSFRNINEKTALDYAKEKGYEEIIDILKKAETK